MANDAKLNIDITASGAKATAEIKGVEKAISKLGSGSVDLQKGFKSAASEASNLVGIFTGNRLTGATSQLTSFSGAVSAIPGPVGLAAGALAGFATAGIAAGVALFAMTKTAAEFGSQIHDASVKTGLGAETISSLKHAADQSGTSLEQFTSGLAKFAKTVGEAGDGSDKATAKLKALGVEPKAALNDLDGSLAKVFKRIGDARPGVEQITLAQKAFGKSGADLIPLMEQVGFNLDAFKAKCKALGITIDDDAAAKADAFGDQLDELKAQLAGVGRAIGTELMPEFSKMASDMGAWLATNKDQWHVWGHEASLAIHDAWAAASSFMSWIESHPNFMAVLFPAEAVYLSGLRQRAQADNAAAHGEDSGASPFAFKRQPATFGGGADESGGAAKAAADRRRSEREQLDRREASAQIEILKNQLSDAKSLYKSTLDDLREEFKKTGNKELFEGGIIGAAKLYGEEAADIFGRLTDAENQFAASQKKTTGELELLRQAQQKRVDDYLAETKTEIETNSKLLTDTTAKDWKEHDERMQAAFELELRYLREIHEQREANLKLVLEEFGHTSEFSSPEAAGITQPKLEKHRDSFSDSFFGNLGGGRFESEAAAMESTMQRLGATGAEAFNGLAEAMGSVVEQWVLTGEFSGANAKRAIAAAFAMASAQSLVSAIMETAYGIAALTPWGAAIYGPAAFHFKSAALFAAVAVATAGAGRAIAGNSGKGGGGSSAGSPGGPQRSSDVTQPYTRENQYSYQSGRNQQSNEGRWAQALYDKIHAMRPGDVLVAGTRERPGHIGESVVRDIGRNSRIGRDIQRSSGNKR